MAHGDETETDIVDVGYSKRFDLWRMRDEIGKLCRRAEAIETDLRVLTRMVNDDTRKRMGECPITGDGVQAICPT